MENSTPKAPVLQTGQSESFSHGDDGAWDMGVPWPTTRFIDNQNGTVTDTLTGLVWLSHITFQKQDNFAAVKFDEAGKLGWRDALIFANYLRNGDVTLQDGSNSGDWRLPNITELLSLVHYGVSNPALPEECTAIVENINPTYYWTSTTDWSETENAWVVNLKDGSTTYLLKTESNHLWPVRDKRVGES